MGRRAPPGWDDIHCEGWRAVKLPIHDLGGCTGFVVVFGGSFDPKRAQAIVERMGILLGPMVSGAQVDGDGSPLTAAEVAAADTARDPAAVLEMHRSMETMLTRELSASNSSSAIETVQNQISEVRAIMERNVEMILDRQEQLESLEVKSKELSDAGKAFRKNTRKIRRYHLMNQVKYGVAIGTAVSAAVAIPVLLLATA